MADNEHREPEDDLVERMKREADALSHIKTETRGPRVVIAEQDGNVIFDTPRNSGDNSK
jgi:hypothetical protein